MTARELLEASDPELLFFDGLDDAIVGTITRCGSPTVVVYDFARCIEVLLRDHPESDEDQVSDDLIYNVMGSFDGERTPCFLHPIVSGDNK